MTGEQILDAMDFLDDDMIGQVDTLRQARRPKVRFLHWGALAASVCIVIAAGLLLPQINAGYFEDGTSMNNPQNNTVNDGDLPDGMPAADPQDHPINAGGPISDSDPYGLADWPADGGIYVEPMDVSLGSGLAMDMNAFFIYNGRSYVEYECVEDETLAGEYLGTATGLIDEWTEEDGYVELAGSVAGEFYAVNGYDPDFLLCMKREDGKLLLFVNNSGLWLYGGSDLLVDRWGLVDGSFATVEYETQESWYRGEKRIKPLSDEDVIRRFLDALCVAEFRHSSDYPLAETELYHLYFRKEDGITVHLRLSEGGYVRFEGIPDACVQVEEAVWNELLTVLEQGE